MPLNYKRRLFVEHYLGDAGGNASKAARMAGYSDPENGRHLIREPLVMQQVEKRIKDVALATDHILGLLAEQAVGSMADFITLDENRKPHIDLAKAEANGKLHLIRKITIHRDGSLELELYDAQAALVNLGRCLKLFTDKIQIEKPNNVVVEYVNDPW